MDRRAMGVLVVALVSAASWAAPTEDVTADVAAVRARSKAVVAAEAARNVEATVAFFADDAVVQLEQAPQIQGREAIGDMYRQWFPGLKEFSGTTSHLAVSRGADLGYEYGVNRMVMAGPNGDVRAVGKYLLVWQKIDGEWFIVALSVTTDAPPAASAPAVK